MNPTDFTTVAGTRMEHLRHAIGQACDGWAIELGVYTGATLMALALMAPARQIVGFDSFLGLPCEWKKNHGVTSPKGSLATPYKPVSKNNVSVVEVWFHESLPKWLAANEGPIGFLHVDCDVYESARVALKLLDRRIVPGTVIVFDELYNWDHPDLYSEWANHEWRALSEWLATGREAIPLARSKGHSAASIKVMK